MISSPYSYPYSKSRNLKMPPKTAKKRSAAATSRPKKVAKLADFDLVRMEEVEQQEKDDRAFAHRCVYQYVCDLHKPSIDEIRPENRWNMDETAYQRQSSYITTYECVSAAGVVLPPLVVFKKEVIEDEWMKENVPDAKFYTFLYNRDKNLKGKKLLEKWFTETFLPNTVPKDKTQWRLLVWDDDKCHSGAEYEFGRLCEKHKVRLLNVSTEVSHFAAPLEAVLTPLIKDKMSKLYKETEIDEEKGEGYAHRWLKMIHAARKSAFGPKQVLEAWRDTGCFPPHQDKIEELGREKGVKMRANKWVIGMR